MFHTMAKIISRERIPHSLLHLDFVTLGASPLSLLVINVPLQFFHRDLAGLTGHIYLYTALTGANAYITW